MRFSLEIDQKRAIEWEIDVSECVMLDLIVKAAGWSETLLHGEQVFYWLAHTKIRGEVPLIATSEQTTRRILARLVEKGLIEIHQFEHKTGYRLTAKGKEWDTTEKDSPKEPNTKMAEPNAKMVGNNVTSDNNTETQKLSAASPRTPRSLVKIEKYETLEEIPGLSDQSENLQYLIKTLYRLNWRWPRSRDLKETIDQLKATLTVAGIMYYTSQGTEGLNQNLFRSELAAFNSYYEQKPTKNALTSFHTWFKKMGTPKVWPKK
jgi:DNA-binding PadR family transcriptional regulator